MIVAYSRNTESSNVRWKTLREACAVLKALESQLRQLSPVQRQLLADKALQNVLPDARDRSMLLMNLLMTKNISTQGRYLMLSRVSKITDMSEIRL